MQSQNISPIQAKTIAVLPFVNMSTSEENEYFSDGMTEEIINALTKIEGLKVTSRTSSFFFKNKNIPIAEIGNTLNVSTILEGSVRLSGNKMRLTAQLIDVLEDIHFWSETFDRSMEDIFAVQDEISLLIADKLREHIGHLEIESSLIDQPAIPIDTYKRYLKSRFLLLKMTKPEIEKGLSLLTRIIEEVPNFALAYLGLHLGYTLMGTIGLMPANEAFVKGQPFLDKAIALDENLPECQLHLSYLSFLQKWDLETTYLHLNKAREIRPTVEFYQSMASVLVAEAKTKAALNYIDIALQMDPFSGINYHLRGFILYVQEEYKEAIKMFEKAIELNPNFMASTLYQGQALLLAGRPAESLAFFQSLKIENATDVMKLGGMSLAYAALGQRTAAKNGIEQLEAVLDTDLMERATSFLILCYTMLGQIEKAIQLVDQAIQSRLPMLVYYKVEPLLKTLHDIPQFQALMQPVLNKPSTFEVPKRKYKKALLSNVQLEKYKTTLEQLMLLEKPYLKPDLTLRSLAKMLGLLPNQLSQLLNEGFAQNFSVFVNTYRLETFKSKVANPRKQHLTILALAYESGFNSKTVFNTFFKKIMGKTPKAYWKEVVHIEKK